MRSVKVNRAEKQKQEKGQEGGRETVGVDLGNSWIRVVCNNKEEVLYAAILIERGNVYVNKRPNQQCTIDVVSLMGKKWRDQCFQQVTKYYNWTFKKGGNQNILVQSNNTLLGEEYYLQLPMVLIFKGIFSTHNHLNFLTASQTHIQLVCTVFQGKLNPFRSALKQCIQLSNIKDFLFVNTNTCIGSSYLRHHRRGRDENQMIGVVDFGAQGMTFSLFRLYHTSPGVIQALNYEISHSGGIKLTNLLVDYVAEQLIRLKGMDVNKSGNLMHKLKLLCDQAKHILSSSQKAFVRLDGLPNIIVYGCQISIKDYEKCIGREIRENVELIKRAIGGKKDKISRIVMSGGSAKTPLFRKMLKQAVGQIDLIDAESTWIKEGLLSVKSKQIHLLDVCPFDLRMQGDQKLSLNLVERGELIPLRKRETLKFPSGQLNLTLKFYQNNELVATCLIPERPRQNTFSLFVQIDHNKMLSIFATTTQGLVKMQSNFIQIPREEYLRYGEVINKFDFHIDNE